MTGMKPLMWRWHYKAGDGTLSLQNHRQQIGGRTLADGSTALPGKLLNLQVLLFPIQGMPSD
jgi:hypothetical protein